MMIAWCSMMIAWCSLVFNDDSLVFNTDRSIRAQVYSEGEPYRTVDDSSETKVLVTQLTSNDPQLVFLTKLMRHKA